MGKDPVKAPENCSGPMRCFDKRSLACNSSPLNFIRYSPDLILRLPASSISPLDGQTLPLVRLIFCGVILKKARIFLNRLSPSLVLSSLICTLVECDVLSSKFNSTDSMVWFSRTSFFPIRAPFSFKLGESFLLNGIGPLIFRFAVTVPEEGAFLWTKWPQLRLT